MAQTAPLTRLHKSDKHSIERFYTEEIVIGLCGPVGVNLPEIAVKIKENLASYNYETKTLKMSAIIQEINEPPSFQNGLERKRWLIEAGNTIRTHAGRGSYLAEKAIEKIFIDRNDAFPDGKFKSRRHCFIIDSIKNQAEAKKFREVYGSSFYLIGAFSSFERKITNLIQTDTALREDAIKIIDLDFNQKGDYGQQVGKVFQTADYFFRLEGDNQADVKVQRLLKLILGAELITPSGAESAMFTAASASRNSACLSRQVGAAIAKQNGDVISTGWNDVPKFGGGTYDFGGKDERCFNNGQFCRNDQEKRQIVEQIVAELEKKGAIDSANVSLAKEALTESRVGDLIEFSRAVHAEMHAILNAGKVGFGDLSKTVLYCTTYPCHSCARHIVAAGISEVYFIEPYPKSQAVKLHSDAITHDETDSGKLKILAFEGVAPNRYLDFFSIKNDRKIDGMYHKKEKADVKPQVDKMFEAVHTLEAAVASGVMDDDGDGGGGGERREKAA